MKTKNIVIISILSVFTLLLTVSFRVISNPLLGKWQLNSKVEEKKQDGNVLESSEKNYKAGKKYYEFGTENKLVIIDDYGKTKEKKKYVVEGSNVFIGKEKSADNMYIMTFKENKVTFLRIKTKTKEGKTTVETDELRLEKVQ